jgi:hypothetical protein
MKPRHAAALALVGWYLMVPPPDVNWKLDGTGPVLPVSKWTHWKSFDTAAQCEQGKLTALQDFDRADPHAADTFWRFAECIASDDPRVNEK